MLGKTLFEVVSSTAGETKRRLIARVDLQPDPGDGKVEVNPLGRGKYCARRDSPASVLRPYPVRQLNTSRAIRHQPHRAEEPPAAKDSNGELTSRSRVPR